MDDICDNGKTLRDYIEYTPVWKHGAKKVMTATVYKHKDSTFTPDFFVEENDKWIVFPYEKD